MSKDMRLVKLMRHLRAMRKFVYDIKHRRGCNQVTIYDMYNQRERELFTRHVQQVGMGLYLYNESAAELKLSFFLYELVHWIWSVDPRFNLNATRQAWDQIELAAMRMRGTSVGGEHLATLLSFDDAIVAESMPQCMRLLTLAKLRAP